MVNVLIVEDEALIRQGMVNCVEWRTYGISIVGAAKNGKQALEILDTVKPEIIITDICMPCMDGLELIQTVKAMNYPADFVIISGYDNFSYAQEAMSYGVQNYILKPVSENDLLKVVIPLARKKEQEKKNNNEEKIKEKVFETNKQYLLENLVSSYIQNLVQLKNNEFCSQLAILGLSLKKFYRIIGFNYNYKTCERISNISDLNLLIRAYFKEQVKSDISVFERYDKVPYLLVTYDEYNPLDIVDMMTRLRDRIKLVENYSIRIGVSEQSDDIAELPVLFKHAFSAMEDINSNNTKIYFYESLLPSTIPETIKEDVDRYISSFDQISIKKYFPLFLYSIVLNGDLFHEQKEIAKSYYYRNKKYLIDNSNLDLLDSIVENCTALYQISDALIDGLGAELQANNSFRHPIVNEALAYIHANYTSVNINCSLIADVIGISASYLGTIFKEDIGESINHYINELRIRKALELMGNPALKIYEISDLVGFSSYRYFSTIFQKSMGCSVKEYKYKK